MIAAVRVRPATRHAIVAFALVVCGLFGSVSGVVNALDANEASIDELQTIRGIGPATAARIVEARRQEPFRDLDDLRERVRGIGEKNLRKMQDAGLAVGKDHVVPGTGRAKVIEPAAARQGHTLLAPKRDGATATNRNGAPATKRDGEAPPIEWHVGRPR
ncbi:MAG: helix-hairpin-helix domain-containing protein [Burkholderiaceae bacterium]|nr:helix-hairpin-helix domain-containing protein [Burkholderiaceae bacterium]